MLKVFLLIFTWRNICCIFTPKHTHTTDSVILSPWYQTKWKQNNNNKKRKQTQSKTDAQQSIALPKKKEKKTHTIFVCGSNEFQLYSLPFRWTIEFSLWLPVSLSLVSFYLCSAAPYSSSPTWGKEGTGRQPYYLQHTIVNGVTKERRTESEIHREGRSSIVVSIHKTSFSMELL